MSKSIIVFGGNGFIGVESVELILSCSVLATVVK